MPVIGLTADGKKIVGTIVTGPTSYPTGGFTVRIPELSKIHAAKVSIKTNLKVNNLVHAVDYTYTGNTITFTVYRIDVTATAPSAWSEVTSGSDISALVLEVIAIGL
jgi:hypothetical protein